VKIRRMIGRRSADSVVLVFLDRLVGQFPMMHLGLLLQMFSHEFESFGESIGMICSISACW